MKKIFFFAAIAAAALSSCSSDELVQAEQPVVEDGAVLFDAYTGRANRAQDVTKNNLYGIGFGVYAYEQGNTVWETYRTTNTMPNFFYNQKVNEKTFDTAEPVAEISEAEYHLLDGNTTVQSNFEPNDESGRYVWNRRIITAAEYAVDAGAEKLSDEFKDYLEEIGSTGTYKIKDANVVLKFGEWNALSDKEKSFFEVHQGPTYVAATSASITSTVYNGLTFAQKQLFTPAAPTGDPEFVYSPIKYFSNNDKAKHSFFAYAPFNEDVKAVFTQTTKGPAIRYNAADNYDLVWANKTDVEKQATTEKVVFDFKHALSKASFKVGYFVDQVHGAHNTSDDLGAETKIVVRNVRFVGVVPSQGLLSLVDGAWTYEASDEGAYEYAPSTPLVLSGDYGKIDATETCRKPFGSNMFVIPSQDADKLKVQVVYDVVTTDKKNSSNNSTVTNVITSKNGFTLEAGKAYEFKLDLGLTSVKFDVHEVGTWGTGTLDNNPVDLPNNE